MMSFPIDSIGTTLEPTQTIVTPTPSKFAPTSTHTPTREPVMPARTPTSAATSTPIPPLPTPMPTLPLPPQITGRVPASTRDGGPVTVTIIGQHLRQSTSVSLIGPCPTTGLCPAPRHNVSGEIQEVIDDSQIECKFDFPATLVQSWQEKWKLWIEGPGGTAEYDFFVGPDPIHKSIPRPIPKSIPGPQFLRDQVSHFGRLPSETGSA